MTTSYPTDTVHEAEHEQNDNWEWSDSFTQFIADAIEGRSLKVCTGLRPIADVNLDIKDLRDVADSQNAAFDTTPIQSHDEHAHELRTLLRDDASPDTLYGRITATETTDTGLYDGYACNGDMYDLPFDDNTFDTTISDPPWLNLSADEREQLFDELVRVTKPTGILLYNATWKPEHTFTNRYKLRFRQQRDFWGGPSLAIFYRRKSRNIDELFDATDYESVERYPEDSPFWSEDYNPEALSTDHNTDPKKISGDSDYRAHCCPLCGCARLGQLTDDYFESNAGQYTTYECLNCELRVDKATVDTLASRLKERAAEQNIPVGEVTDIDYTPPEVERHLEGVATGNRDSTDPITPELPWVPTQRVCLLNDDYALDGRLEELDLSLDDACNVLELMAAYPSVKNRTDGDLTELPTTEFHKRFKTLARALNTATFAEIHQHITTRKPTAKPERTTQNQTETDEKDVVYDPSSIDDNRPELGIIRT